MFKPNLVVEKPKLLLPLDIQFFSENPGGQDGGGTETQTGTGTENPGGEETKQDKQDTTATGGETKEDKKDTSKTFTQDNVNDIVAREKRKAQEQLFKQLGITDAKSAKEALEKYNEMTEAQKTDQQKLAEKATNLEAENGTYKTTVANLEAQIAVLKADVKPEAVEDVMVLANKLVDEDTDIDKAVKNVLKKHPYFKKDGQVEEGGKQKPKFTEGQHTNDAKQTEKEQWGSAFKLF